MTGDDQHDRRGAQLLFALVALLHAPLSIAVAQTLWRSSWAFPWTAATSTLVYAISLALPAFIAWLAFARLDTRAGIRVLPRRWSDAGGIVVAAFMLGKLVQALLLCGLSPAELDDKVRAWGQPFIDPSGELLLGWLLLAMTLGAIAEELVYRALLLRALEGFVAKRAALVGQALVFELVHVFVYGWGFTGGAWFGLGLLFGYAFQRTRSLAVPVLLHAGWNVSFVVLLWWLGR
jgi:membrane protease YdiL (CAAX protease family)